MTTRWTGAEETTIAQIMSADGCSRLEAIRRMRRRAESIERVRVPSMNVSKEADAEFLRALEREDPERYARLLRNMRRDDPNAGMTEDQALTNFMLGLTTGRFRFAVVAGDGAPVSPERKNVDRLLRDGTDEEWVQAIVALANAPDPIYKPQPVSQQSPISPLARKLRKRIKQARASRKASQSRKRAANGTFQPLTLF